MPEARCCCYRCCACATHAPDYGAGAVVGQRTPTRSKPVSRVRPVTRSTSSGVISRLRPRIWSIAPKRGCDIEFLSSHPFSKMCQRIPRTQCDVRNRDGKRTYSSAWAAVRVKAWIGRQSAARLFCLFSLFSRCQQRYAVRLRQGLPPHDKDRLADCGYRCIAVVVAWRRSPMCSQRPQNRGGSDKYVAWWFDVVCGPNRPRNLRNRYAWSLFMLMPSRANRTESGPLSRGSRSILVADFVDRLFPS